MEDQKRNVVVLAPATLEGNGLVHLIATMSADWTCTQVLLTDVARSALVFRKASLVVLASDAFGDHTLPAMLPADVPIVAVGGEVPPARLRVHAWVKRPSSAVLRPLIVESLERPCSHPPPVPITSVDDVPSEIPPPSSASGMWRRKSDMIIGRSAGIRRVLDALERISASPAAVSITGESGTGKELVARALHYSSPRATAPFIALNCAAIPESLFEAELFGYVRGAFTGAVSTRIGAFEGAHNGTLFLDEIGEMPLTLQPKLLRVLERGEITRLGSNESRQVSVRVVTATNRDLQAEVKANRFRQDLYYRLHVCHVDIPPLRQRTEDVAPLVSHHLSIIAAREQRTTTPRLSPTALEKLVQYSWPGNVRELVNVLESAVLLAPTNTIEPEHLQLRGSAQDSGADGQQPDAAVLAYREAKARFETEYFTRLLAVSRGNVSLASKLAQKTRKEIYEALRRVGIDAGSYRDDEMA